MLNLPCSCSSAYLCTKVKLERLGCRWNLTLVPVVLLLLAGTSSPLMYVLGFSPSLWGRVYIEAVSAKHSYCWDAAARVSLNRLWVFSPPYVLDTALYPAVVEKKDVPESQRFQSSADINGHHSIDLSGMTLACASSGVSVVRRESGGKQL